MVTKKKVVEDSGVLGKINWFRDVEKYVYNEGEGFRDGRANACEVIWKCMKMYKVQTEQDFSEAEDALVYPMNSTQITAANKASKTSKTDKSYLGEKILLLGTIPGPKMWVPHLTPRLAGEESDESVTFPVAGGLQPSEMGGEDLYGVVGTHLAGQAAILAEDGTPNMLRSLQLLQQQRIDPHGKFPKLRVNAGRQEPEWKGYEANPVHGEWVTRYVGDEERRRQVTEGKKHIWSQRDDL